MKIGHSFDTRHKHKKIQELLLCYPSDKILIIPKSISHRIIIGMIPYGLRCGVLLVGLIMAIRVYGRSTNTALTGGVLLGVFLLSTLYQWYRLFVIHYGDYVIVSPDMICIYNQRGLLNRTKRAIYIRNIAGISVDKHGFLNSIMNEGTLTIEEVGVLHDSTISFGPIAHPDSTSDSIEKIISSQGLVAENDYLPKK